MQVRGGSEPGSPAKFNGEINGEIGGDGSEVGLGVRPPSVGAASQPASSIHSGGVGIESDSEEEREQQPDHRPPHRSRRTESCPVAPSPRSWSNVVTKPERMVALYVLG